MILSETPDLYQSHPLTNSLSEALNAESPAKFSVAGVVGAVLPCLAASVAVRVGSLHIFVMDDKDEAAYFYNDLVGLCGDASVRFLPFSFHRLGDAEEDRDKDAVLLRTEVLNALNEGVVRMVVTYTEALSEGVIRRALFSRRSLPVEVGEHLSMERLNQFFDDGQFEYADFVFEPGQFSIRGGIVDVFSYGEERPVRIEFSGDEVESLRYFDIDSQRSDVKVPRVVLVPDLVAPVAQRTSLVEYLGEKAVWWLKQPAMICNRADSFPEQKTGMVSGRSLFDSLNSRRVVVWGGEPYFKKMQRVTLHVQAQPPVNKRFDLLAQHLRDKQKHGYRLFVSSLNPLQVQRLRDIFDDKGFEDVTFQTIEGVLHEGFEDDDLKIVVYTEHQLFDRYHKYQLKSNRIRKGRESFTINDLQQLHPGDYVVHIDYGIGQFGGLVHLNNNGREQETIRLVYKGNSELFVSLHALHKISKYKGKEGEPPVLNRLGGEAWQNLKQRTKNKVKDIARELIMLYAKRQQEPAFAFSHDSYLQEEMEAHFAYEETPDQLTAIQDVKHDMEQPRVMERLICGDVGFGKTEVAIRAAFKAVLDSRQVAVLVPTTILAYQHYITFSERLKGMPCRVEYISRMRKPAEIKEVLQDLTAGKVDIVIGTHRLLGKDVQFKSLGLLVIDEEQKFGVAMKERLKKYKLNVDTITMTATPIPRTLQFSLMGARDLSIIQTPPPNRYPIVTEIHRFDNQLIHDAIAFEVSRRGQVFFIHNRVDNIFEMERTIQRLLPGVTTCVGHGQMSGDELEQVMYRFMRGDFDVLISTTIIESGLDIPNVNTIIINQAHRFGLSELHQLRGRVGRSNRKAFCYLLTPPLESINTDARRRLKAIEDYSGLGSGFNIAMQDLDIRGAGNILGSEQSGFISEIGYETYQRLLKEALHELWNEEFKSLASTEQGKQVQREYERTAAADCVLDTDFELLIPDEYVGNVTERLRLYRLLDNIVEEEEMQNFRQDLIDRFGPLPEQVKGLLEMVGVRRSCTQLGINRLMAKQERMWLYFIPDLKDPFYDSDVMKRIVDFVRQQVLPCSLEEKAGRNYLLFHRVPTASSISSIIKKLHTYCYEPGH